MKPAGHTCFRAALGTLCIAVAGFSLNSLAESYDLKSPNGTVQAAVNAADKLTLSVTVDGKKVLEPSVVSMTLAGGRVLGENLQVKAADRRTISQELKPVVPEKFAVIQDNCNELTLNCGDYSVAFRAYDNGVAYRFQTKLPGQITVQSEKSDLDFVAGSKVFYPEETTFFSHNERTYLHENLDEMAAGRLASLPLLVAAPNAKVLVTESGLRDYAGMWVRTAGEGVLSATFPPYALEAKLKQGNDRDVPVVKAADFIAKTEGTRNFPWRILAIAKQDKDLLANTLVFQLAEEQKLKDVSWIRAGKVAWDWWNANNLSGVDFKAGVNTETYKYYIDFASSMGLEYIILDEGWYKLGDLLAVVPEVNVQELVDYGKKKNVGIILWVVWKTLDDQLQPALDQFQKWGVKGIKVDFMQRDDQWMVDYYWRVADEAAKRKLLVDYHGAYKPCGLRRAYPNVITREGVKGLENSKWSKDITPTHDVTLPFIRMVAGPMDFTPGATLNEHPAAFFANFQRPMSMGTRAHQAAMYVVFESPLQMLADSPSNYKKEMEFTKFISRIPTTWDKTVPLDAAVGEYVAVARKNGKSWYIGAMSNEKARELTLNLSFLDGKSYKAEIFKDGINAERHAQDYKIETLKVSNTDSLKVKLAPGGGWSAILTPR